MPHTAYYNSFRYRFSKPFKIAWFRYLVNKDKLIKIDYRHRGIGKTHILVEKAIKYDIPIFVGVKHQAELIKRRGNPCEIHNYNEKNIEHLIRMDFPNGILIDETFNPSLIALIESKGIKIRGGFIRKDRGGISEWENLV